MGNDFDTLNSKSELIETDEIIPPNDDNTEHGISEDEEMEDKISKSEESLEEIQGNEPTNSRESCIYGSDCYRYFVFSVSVLMN